MKKLIINNIGPIKHVELELKQVNVIIGPQGSGKSCILKVASFCAWLEKRILIDRTHNVLCDKNLVERELVEFHKLKGLVDEKSYFRYVSDYVEMEFHGEFITYTRKDSQWSYKKGRVSYIPAERSIISVVPNIFEVNFGKDYMKSFIKDWNIARKCHPARTPLPIVGLPISYHYDESRNEDVVDVEADKSISLTNASSGIQSLVPMCSYLDYLFDQQYSAKAMTSAEEDSRNLILALDLHHSRYFFPMEDAATNAFVGYINSMPYIFRDKKDYEECAQIYKNHTQISHSDIYLEEPELNIFPQTQIQLVRYLLEKIKLHDDNLFLATHSHYILYALNNCMLGYKVAENVRDAGDEEMLKNQKSWTDPDRVGVWELRDGKLNPVPESPSNTIQDKDGLIRGNYFDRVMHNVMADFTNLMNYYE